MIYTISISRRDKSWAVFDDGWKCVKEFIPYLDEQTAIAEGRAWVKERSPDEPRIVYPRITKLQMW
jgi:hypothetical protein